VAVVASVLGGLATVAGADGSDELTVVLGLGGARRWSTLSVLADWDGRDDLTADREGRVAEIGAPFDGNVITRVAVSEHTMANGFGEDVFYYGDAVGNVYVAATSALGAIPPAPDVLTINLPPGSPSTRWRLSPRIKADMEALLVTIAQRDTAG
jgi:hypothetical protein